MYICMSPCTIDSLNSITYNKHGYLHIYVHVRNEAGGTKRCDGRKKTLEKDGQDSR